MKFSFSEGKIVIRFTVNFILHQILLLTIVSIPAIIFLYVLKRSPTDALYYNLVAWLSVILYILYCLFYGCYVAFPMANIVFQIKRLANGDYQPYQKRRRFLNPANGLYREVYANLGTLTATLQENKQKRLEFENQRQEWAAGVTHDLKTPLSYITGYTDMMLSKQHEWSEAEKAEFLQIIKGKAAYMEDLINDLGLAFRMDQQTGMQMSSEKIELVELLRRVVAETASMPAERKKDFEILGDDQPIYIIGDYKLLRRGFSNLLVNSVVHNPEGIKITVQIIDDALPKIQISDNGSGMNEDDTKHLFDRYYRGTSTDTPVGGTGLGMAIVKQIIEAHHGTIEVQSKLGEGTVFTLQFYREQV